MSERDETSLKRDNVVRDVLGVVYDTELDSLITNADRNVRTGIRVTDFVNLFGDAIPANPPTAIASRSIFNALMARDSNNTKGFKQIFENWKAEGYVE